MTDAEFLFTYLVRNGKTNRAKILHDTRWSSRKLSRALTQMRKDGKTVHCVTCGVVVVYELGA